MSTKPKTVAETAPKHPLVGRGFHTQGRDSRTEWQGEVLADCGGGYFLIQLFGWIAGDPQVQNVFHITELAAKHDNGIPRFRFFDSMEHANSYMQTVARYRDDAIDRRLDKEAEEAERDPFTVSPEEAFGPPQ